MLQLRFNLGRRSRNFYSMTLNTWFLNFHCNLLKVGISRTFVKLIRAILKDRNKLFFKSQDKCYAFLCMNFSLKIP